MDGGTVSLLYLSFEKCPEKASLRQQQGRALADCCDHKWTLNKGNKEYDIMPFFRDNALMSKFKQKVPKDLNQTLFDLKSIYTETFFFFSNSPNSLLLLTVFWRVKDLNLIRTSGVGGRIKSNTLGGESWSLNSLRCRCQRLSNPCLLEKLQQESDLSSPQPLMHKAQQHTTLSLLTKRDIMVNRRFLCGVRKLSIWPRI